MERWFLPTVPEMMDWVYIFEYVHQRGRVGESNGIQFIIHTAENGHNKPHLHARYQQKEVVLEIPSGKVITGTLGDKKTKAATKWVIDHAVFLEDKWDELVGGVVCFG